MPRKDKFTSLSDFSIWFSNSKNTNMKIMYTDVKPNKPLKKENCLNTLMP
jgi:hypothetical protein